MSDDERPGGRGTMRDLLQELVNRFVRSAGEEPVELTPGGWAVLAFVAIGFALLLLDATPLLELPGS